MDAQDYATVIKTICNRLDISTPDDTLIRNVTAYCKKLNHPHLKQLYADKLSRFDAIVKSYLESIAHSPEQKYDLSSHIKQKTKKIEALSTAWIDDRMPIVSSKAMSVYIDSRLRNVDSFGETITDFVFSLVPRQTRSQIGDGRIQARVMPSQITYMKIGKIILPYSASRRQTNSSREITLTFTAIRSNGILAREDTYHFAFIFEVDSLNSNLVQLTPVQKYCKFSPPLRMVDNLSLRFNDPIYPISFSNDRLMPTSFNYLSSDGRIDFVSSHQLTSGDVVIIDGLKTDDDAKNSTILSQINNPRGHVITVIDANTISIGINFTQISSPRLSSKPLVLFYSNMFRFPLEIGYQDVSELP